MNSFEKIKKNFGLGCMRFPMSGENADFDKVNKMIDLMMENGFNYFDTARGYMNQKSECTLKKCLTSRYDRESYVLTNKLSTNFFNKSEEILPYFESQLEECGVEYFDFYLMHAQDKNLYEKYRKCNAYEIALQLKEQGKINHLGISFHDKAEVLEQILNDYPQIEIVQIQFNYADYEDSSVESRKCYEVCRKYNKPVVVMEPVKGGCLADLPNDAKKILDDLEGGSAASYALRFAAGFESIVMVLSGMSSIEMVEENINFMKDFKPLDEKEKGALEKVLHVLKSKDLISCTACRYCIDSCPKKILIPDLFSCFNGKKIYNSWSPDYYYGVHTQKNGKASDCIKCGKCEEMCPQHLSIRELLKDVANMFEHK